MTPKRLQCRLRYWQRVLRLNDWEIELRIVRRVVLDGAVGRCESPVYRSAIISLADPVDFTADDSPRMADLEDTLIHELVHLHMKDLGVVCAKSGQTMSPEQVAEERAVEALAGALLKLERARVAG